MQKTRGSLESVVITLIIRTVQLLISNLSFQIDTDLWSNGTRVAESASGVCAKKILTCKGILIIYLNTDRRDNKHRCNIQLDCLNQQA